MNWRWLLFDYSDPRLPIGRRERARIWARMIMHHSEQRLDRPESKSEGCMGSFFLAAAIGAVIFAPLAVINLWALLGVLPFAWILAAYLGRWTYAPALRRSQRELGYEVCIKCGYWLKGLPDDIDKCPECGCARKLAASEAEQEVPTEREGKTKPRS